jgi:hypothetical protein
MNDFHTRLCRAQSETNMLDQMQIEHPEYCLLKETKKFCNFVQFAIGYYNYKSQSNNIIKFFDIKHFPLLVLASIIGK